ncbi:alpha/beta-hydrolases superfamily protein [Anaeramoeba flamelloides]|uniref:Alpha/beta-hydrolases superfamily protein n=1 Tax=Anaeramoeba flamelloides TaxID=1746091 RepID=A0AAV7YPZ4_9EUKA|nr:alpha/beta-hydrolases superfamily protein [Anaeramoeba flamelloides]
MKTNNGKNKKKKMPFQNRKRLNIIFSHGNGESIYELGRFATRVAHKTNCNVHLFEYPGYPQTQGKRRENNCYQSAEAIYQWLVNEKNVPADDILWFGHSLGSAVVMEIASKYPCKGILLLSPILSIFRSVLKIGLNLPYDMFINLKRAPKVDKPVMVIHGTQDKVVPIKHGKKLFKLFPNQFDSVWINNANHNNIESRFRIRFYREINRFLDFLISENGKNNQNGIDSESYQGMGKENESESELEKGRKKRLHWKKKTRKRGNQKNIKKKSTITKTKIIKNIKKVEIDHKIKAKKKKKKPHKKHFSNNSNSKKIRNSNSGFIYNDTSSSTGELFFDLDYNILNQKSNKMEKNKYYPNNKHKNKQKNLKKSKNISSKKKSKQQKINKHSNRQKNYHRRKQF